MKGGRGSHILVSSVAALMVSATFFSQHPNRVFDSIRSLDRVGFWLPNWRFFAPEPAQNDFQLLFRTLSVDDEESEWIQASSPAPRRIVQSIWFPSRRRDKGVFDAVVDLVTHFRDPRTALSSPPNRVLCALIEDEIRTRHAAGSVQGYQYKIDLSAGYDCDVSSETILSSPFIPLRSESSKSP